MSLSKPFFNSRPSSIRRNYHSDFVSDEEFKLLHWTEQERLKRRYDTPKPYRETGDSDNRLDNWEVDDEPQDKQ